MKNFKLEKEFWERWKANLLSGKYEQGQSTLVYFENDPEDSNGDDESFKKKTEPHYCCLGVAGITAGMDNKQLYGKDMLSETHVPKNIKIPNILLGAQSPGERYAFVDILAALNDTLTAEFYRTLQRQYEGLVFHKLNLESTNMYEKYTFKDIVRWIEDNVEMI